MENIEELLDFFLVANDETRRNVTGLMKVHTLLLLFILKNYLSILGLEPAFGRLGLVGSSGGYTY